MKRGVVAFAGLVALAFAVGSATAADLPPRYQQPYAPAPVYAPVFSWTGFYIGINGGGGWGRSQWDGVDKFNISGGLIGATIGYNWQINQFVLGAEGDIDWSGIGGSTTFACAPGCTTRNHWLSTVRGRLGYAFDRVLVYGKGGAAMAADRYDVSGSFTGIPFGFTGLENRFGWTAGAGVEWAFTPHWSVNVEYDYYGFGTKTIAMFDPVNLFLGNVDVKQNIQVVKVGFNFHIWGPGL